MGGERLLKGPDRQGAQLQGVWKCKCYYSGMARPTDQEMTATEKMIRYSPQEEGQAMPCHPRGHTGKRQGWSEGRGNRRNVGKAFTVVSVGTQGEQAQDRPV